LFLEDGVLRQGGDMLDTSFLGPHQGGKALMEASVFSESVFRSLQEVPLSLGEDELAWYAKDIRLPATVTFGGRVWAAREITELRFFPSFSTGVAIDSLYLVVKDEADVHALLPNLGEYSPGDPRFVFILQADMEGSSEEKEAFVSAFEARFHEYRYFFVRDSLRSEMYALYGGFLFVGSFMGALFLIATALIIYFKQISEGYQDQDRFVILQKVGMSASEVRRTVNTQILIVFFLPLAVAICHAAGSLHMITLIMRLLQLSNAPSIAANIFLAAIFVTLLYGAFFAKTAKTYYKMVRF
jgi:putative ABC transport system permease protein